MKRLQRIFVAFCVVYTMLYFTGVVASKAVIPSKPSVGYVLDQTGTLTQAEIQKINSVANVLETSKKVSMATLIISTTNGEAIEQYAHRVAEKWKPGIDGVGKGALLVIAKADRKFRVEVSRNLEGEWPDGAIKNVLDSNKKYFKDGKFGDGIVAVISALTARAEAPAPAAVAVASADEGVDPLWWVGLFSVILIACILVYHFWTKAQEEKRREEQEAADRKWQMDLEAMRKQRKIAEQRELIQTTSTPYVSPTARPNIRVTPSTLVAAAAVAGLAGAAISKPKPKPAPVRRSEPEPEPYRSSYRSSSSDDSSSRSSSSSSSDSSSFSSSSSSDYSGGGSSSSFD